MTTKQAVHPTSPLRICRRCGIDPRGAATQAEPICPGDPSGMVAGHSYIDVEPAGPNVEVVAGLRDLASFLEAHPELPCARWASVSLRAIHDEHPARETLELVAGALGERAVERCGWGSDVEIAGEFGPCQLRASASVAELTDPEPEPVKYEPIIPVSA